MKEGASRILNLWTNKTREHELSYPNNGKRFPFNLEKVYPKREKYFHFLISIISSQN